METNASRNNMLKYLIGIIIAIILLIGTYLIGYHHGSSELKVTKVSTSETSWLRTELQHKAKQAAVELDKTPLEEITIDPEVYRYSVLCNNSSLAFSHYTKDNYLYVTAFDQCKSAEAKFKIATKNGWTMYAVVGLAGIAIGTTAVLLLR
jgi:hypothetical protein